MKNKLLKLLKRKSKLQSYVLYYEYDKTWSEIRKETKERVA